MYKEDFHIYLSKNTKIDLETIKTLFEKNGDDVFQVALTLNSDYGIDKAKLGKLWGTYLGFAYVDPNTTIVKPEYLEKAGVNFILETQALPLYKFGRAVTVTTSDPLNPYLQNKMERKLDEIVSLVFCFPFDIKNYLVTHNIK